MDYVLLELWVIHFAFVAHVLSVYSHLNVAPYLQLFLSVIVCIESNKMV